MAHSNGNGSTSKKKYNDLSKQELIARIHLLEKKQKTKYGLVWEDKSEDVVEQCRRELPYIKEITSKAIDNDPDKPVNLLIEGDNYHALSVLNYTHKGKIDVIYIDPPYNTKNKDFYFDDSYVDKEDSFRHSKWLSFMYRRLNLAKDLLHNKGVMFVSIDDNEQAQLRLLLNKIFGENNVDLMIWRKSGYGRDGKMKNTTTFRKDHEYIIACYKREKKLNKMNEIPEFQNEYGNSDNDPRGSYKAGSISRREDASNPNHKNYYTVTSPSGKEYTRQFDFCKEELDALNADIVINDYGKKVSRIYWGIKGSAVPAIKIFLKEERAITPYSVLLTKGTTTEGTKELSEILEQDCTKMRPKPTILIKTLIQLADKRDNLTVLDFFAGSGTTGHAVSMMNKQDNGNRKFILCTNNENGIAQKICYPRIKKIIQGYSLTEKDKTNPREKKEGLGGNLKYYKTEFVSAEVTDQNKMKLTDKAGDMLCVREGTYEQVETAKHYKIYRNKEKYTGIVYRAEAIENFKKAIANINGKFIVYIFSLGDEIYEEEFLDMGDKVIQKPVPEAILRVYRRIFHKKGS